MFLDDLITRGGPVLYILFFITFVILNICLTKYIFIYVETKMWFKEKINQFVNDYPPSTYKIHHLEKTIVAEFKRESMSNIKSLEGLIAMCPMIGLLGTVYGMIEVFEVLSFLGTGNPRAMSSGVAMATIPTMAAMVITLFGLYFYQDLQSRLKYKIVLFKNTLKDRGYSH